MKRIVVTLSPGGKIGTEFEGFNGNGCLKAAAEIAKELEKLGIVSEITDLQMKDTSETPAVAQKQAAEVKIERG